MVIKATDVANLKKKRIESKRNAKKNDAQRQTNIAFRLLIIRIFINCTIVSNVSRIYDISSTQPHIFNTILAIILNLFAGGRN